MAHNSTSTLMFRPRVYLIILFVVVVLCVFGETRAISFTRPLNGQTGDVGRRIRVRTGVDVLEADNFGLLRGKRVGIITNQTGIDSADRSTIDVIARASGVKLVAIFSPEHGIAGRLDSNVGDATDPSTGLRIYSLYGDARRPTDAMLTAIDTLVFDVQDAGVRFYTYTTTMAYCMEEAAKRHISFVVLDRPNPIGGEVIEGPMLDADKLSFVGYFAMPVRYAMTMGELALMFNAENKIGADLHVVAMKNWRRTMAYDETGLKWIPPSPNLRTLRAAFLYPGIDILQAGGVSVGRGTDAPFEQFGAPWIHAAALAEDLNRRKIAGVKFVPVTFTPGSDLHKDQACEGVAIQITDRAAIRSMSMGLEIAVALHRMYPEQFQLEKIITLVGSHATLEALERGEKAPAILASWTAELEKFRATREKYLLYH